MDFTWQRGDVATQEKQLDGFYMSNKEAHLTCRVHGGGAIDSDHRIVETV
jgi:hypothetical protein